MKWIETNVRRLHVIRVAYAKITSMDFHVNVLLDTRDHYVKPKSMNADLGLVSIKACVRIVPTAMSAPVRLDLWGQTVRSISTIAFLGHAKMVLAVRMVSLRLIVSVCLDFRVDFVKRM